jgi:hypothetical protein
MAQLNLLSKIKANTYLKEAFNSTGKSKQDKNGNVSLFFKQKLSDEAISILNELGARPKGSESLGVWTINHRVADELRETLVEGTETLTLTPTTTTTPTTPQVYRLRLVNKSAFKEKARVAENVFAQISGGVKKYNTSPIILPLPKPLDLSMFPRSEEFQSRMTKLHGIATTITKSFNDQSEALKVIMDEAEVFTPEDMEKIRNSTLNMISFGSLVKEELLNKQKVAGQLSALGMAKSMKEIEEIVEARVNAFQEANKKPKLPHMNTNSYVELAVQTFIEDTLATVEKYKDEPIDYSCFDELKNLNLLPSDDKARDEILDGCKVFCSTNNVPAIDAVINSLRDTLFETLKNLDGAFPAKDRPIVEDLITMLYDFLGMSKNRYSISKNIGGFLEDLGDAALKFWNITRLLLALFIYGTLLMSILGLNPQETFGLFFGPLAGETQASRSFARNEMASRMSVVRSNVVDMNTQMRAVNQQYGGTFDPSTMYNNADGLIDWENVFKGVDQTNTTLNNAMEPVRTKFETEETRIDTDVTQVSVNVFRNAKSRGETIINRFNMVKDPVIKDEMVKAIEAETKIANVTEQIGVMNFTSAQEATNLQDFISQDLNINVTEPWSVQVLERIRSNTELVGGEDAANIIANTTNGIVDTFNNLCDKFNTGNDPRIKEICEMLGTQIADLMGSVRLKARMTNTFLESKVVDTTVFDSLVRYTRSLENQVSHIPSVYEPMKALHDSLLSEMSNTMNLTRDNIVGSFSQARDQFALLPNLTEYYNDYMKVFTSGVPFVYSIQQLLGRFTNFTIPLSTNATSVASHNVSTALNSISTIHSGLDIGFATVLANQLGFESGSAGIISTLMSSGIGFGAMTAQSALNGISEFLSLHPNVPGLASTWSELITGLMLNTVVLARGHIFNIIKATIHAKRVYNENERRKRKKIEDADELNRLRIINAQNAFKSAAELELEKKAEETRKRMEESLRDSDSESTGPAHFLKKITSWVVRNMHDLGVTGCLGSLTDIYADGASKWILAVAGINSISIIANALASIIRIPLAAISSPGSLVATIWGGYTNLVDYTIDIGSGGNSTMFNITTQASIGTIATFSMSSIVRATLTTVLPSMFAVGAVVGVILKMKNAKWKELWPETKTQVKEWSIVLRNIWKDFDYAWTLHFPLIATASIAEKLLKVNYNQMKAFEAAQIKYEKERSIFKQFFDIDFRLNDNLKEMSPEEFEERKIFAIFALSKAWFLFGANWLTGTLSEVAWKRMINRGPSPIVKDKLNAINYFINNDTERLNWLLKYKDFNVAEMNSFLKERLLPPVMNPFLLRKFYFLYDTLQITDQSLIKEGIEDIRKIAGLFANYLTSDDLKAIGLTTKKLLIGS